MKKIIEEAYKQRHLDREEQFEEKFVWMAPEMKQALEESNFVSSKYHY